MLDALDRRLARQDTGDREEAGLEHRVDQAAQAGLARDARGVDHEQPQPLVEDALLERARQPIPGLVGRMRTVEQQGCAGLRQGQHVDPVQEAELMAGHEARPADQVGSANRPRSESQVRNGLRTRLVRIVDEVALRVAALVLGQDLHAVLVRTHGAVGTEPVEHGPHDVVGLDVELGLVVQAGAGYVVEDTHGKAVAGLGPGQLVEHGLDHGRGEVLGRQPVTAADHPRHRRPLPVATARARVVTTSR